MASMSILRLFISSFLVLLLVLVVAAVPSSAQEVRPDEPLPAEKTAKKDLYTLPGLDHGLIQSPVNILTSRTQKGQHQVVFNANGSEALNEAEVEHSVRLDFTPGATVSSGGKIYDFLQCHFHTPSEHQINGVTYPMELHCVNKFRSEQSSAEYLVVAFLFEMGTQNSFVAKFLDRIPEKVGPSPIGANLPESKEPFALTDLGAELLPEDAYYFYKGSLTTPPYTEAVDWHILGRIFEASPAQIRRINRLAGNNARRIHMLNDRVVGVAP